ncbi:glycosyltransferase family 8B [Tripterygium wilfordii]|uniref:Glycosyltransferase family 8B n=1 Tax=Tripterygium wilfordii TaxID=458696 RepID=A0A7J7C0Q9_TRIWF|nr:putative UDP-glucuronate:xylan alpha-glucuronosyltransferase 3 [Tripterygium wilfordii]KAF5727701.1 glycosyltransferase family 8B [Tripterygium wilfordii]
MLCLTIPRHSSSKIQPWTCGRWTLQTQVQTCSKSYDGGNQGCLNEILLCIVPNPVCASILEEKTLLCFRDYDCNWNVDIFNECGSDVVYEKWLKFYDVPEQQQ